MENQVDKRENEITTSEFAAMLLSCLSRADRDGGNGVVAAPGAEGCTGEAAGETPGDTAGEGSRTENGCRDALWRRGMEKGWLEEQERLEAEKPIERRTAAKIAHMFLRREWGEADEADWGAAKRLKDLYDCRVCANHVAQVYAKGIMAALSGEVFGMREALGREEAVEIAKRLTDRRRRRPPLGTETDSAPSRWLTRGRALALAAGDARAILVDVRSREAYAKGHLDGAVNVPLSVLLEDPDAVTADRTALLLLYCDGGYQSEAAAGRLAEAGFLQAYGFAAEEWP